VGLRKIRNFPSWPMGPRKISEPCLSPEHTPPMHYNYTPGTYEYTCPGCGKVYRFTAGVTY
jgi:hypothetical protein